ncbi:acyltransferase family protein [Shewanella glacialipiscicola]|uniref:acyltransferase family protein n=1 Tax=Shewanella glacialipiscicola TaxID=614069 RepID=UPI003D7AF5A8
MFVLDLKDNLQTEVLTPKKFRHDINGLRAWAVVAVVLYHFGVPGFAGGFVGVDVFFVISGFLMTGIIISGLERGNFSLWGFYLARARRIIPALLVLCASLLILGWFWLPNADYKMLAPMWALPWHLSLISSSGAKRAILMPLVTKSGYCTLGLCR